MSNELKGVTPEEVAEALRKEILAMIERGMAMGHTREEALFLVNRAVNEWVIDLSERTME